MNLLRDPELLDLMKLSRCICIFMGFESVLPESLAEVSKTFNKPEQYPGGSQWVWRGRAIPG